MVVNIEIPTLFPSATWRAGRKRVDPARLADESRGHYSNLRGEVAAKRRRGGPTYNGGKRGEKGMGCSPIPFRGRPGTGCRQDGAVLAQARTIRRGSAAEVRLRELQVPASCAPSSSPWRRFGYVIYDFGSLGG
jgi:hypothetical protein